MSYDIQDIKDKITIPELLRKLGFECPDKLDCMIKSPLRDERSASFHIFDRGERGHDFGGDFTGDVIDLFKEMHGCDMAGAIEAVADFAGVGKQDKSSSSLHAPKIHRRKRVEVPEPYVWSEEVEGIAREACSRLIRNQSGDINALMVKKGWGFQVVIDLAREGHLGVDEDGKILYIYPEGIKKRWDVHSSRGDRWLYGKAKDNLWRGVNIINPEITKVFLAEGETDLVSWLRFRPDREGELSSSIAGASWTPAPVMCHKVASHRDVYLMFDCDKAGFEVTKRVSSLLNEHATGCTVHALSWKKISKEQKLDACPDLGLIKLNQLKERIDNYFVIV